MSLWFSQGPGRRRTLGDFHVSLSRLSAEDRKCLFNSCVFSVRKGLSEGDNKRPRSGSRFWPRGKIFLLSRMRQYRILGSGVAPRGQRYPCRHFCGAEFSATPECHLHRASPSLGRHSRRRSVPHWPRGAKLTPFHRGLLGPHIRRDRFS
jgi:hypothetical protein